jgi:hypothetical protein
VLVGVACAHPRVLVCEPLRRGCDPRPDPHAEAACGRLPVQAVAGGAAGSVVPSREGSLTCRDTAGPGTGFGYG